MSSFDNDLFNDDANDTDLVKSLRKALKDKDKALREKDDILATYSKKERASSLADVLKEKGLDSKVTKLYPADAETTPEAVDAWLAEFGDLFGIQQQNGTTADEETQQAAARIAGASANAPSGNAAFDVQSLVAEIANAKNDTELAAAYAKAGLK
jgi:hypothetical protein